MQEKEIHNGCSMGIENFVNQDNCSASLGKPRDAEQLPSWQNFQSARQATKDSYNKDT